MLNINKYVVLLGRLKELLVVLEQFDGWLCDKDVNAALDGVQSDGVVGGVRGENSDYRKFSSFRGSTSKSYLLALPFGRASIAVLYESGSVLPSLGNSSNATSRPLYASEMFFCKCSPMRHEYS